MEDFSEKNIEDVKVGERVMGIDGKAYNVTQLDITHLGYRSLLKFADDSLSWSEEHPIWTRFKDGHEYWGVWGLGAYLREMEIPHDENLPEYGLRKRPPELTYLPDLEYAHVDGWKKQVVKIDRRGYDEMPLYDLVTDGPGTMICNGYVVSAFATDKDFDFGKLSWKGLKRGE